MIDSRHLTKDFIEYICGWVESEYKTKNHDGFTESLNEEEGYLVADKGIEKRIQKQLFKRLNLKSLVKYEIDPRTGEGKLYIRLLKDEYIPSIKMPRELLGRL